MMRSRKTSGRSFLGKPVERYGIGNGELLGLEIYFILLARKERF